MKNYYFSNESQLNALCDAAHFDELEVELKKASLVTKEVHHGISAENLYLRICEQAVRCGRKDFVQRISPVGISFVVETKSVEALRVIKSHSATYGALTKKAEDFLVWFENCKQKAISLMELKMLPDGRIPAFDIEHEGMRVISEFGGLRFVVDEHEYVVYYPEDN